MQLYDVDDVRYVSDLSKFFSLNLGPSTTLFTLHKNQTPRSLFATSEDHHHHGGDFASPTPQSKPGAIDFVSLKPAMDRARVIKDAYEIALIRKANDISSAAHRHVARQLLRLRNEQEIEAMLVASCTARGAHTQAYHIIAGAGVNASTLHYDANDQSLKGKQLVVIDAGCEYNCYASDITRTLPISGAFTQEARSIYFIVESMQEECIAAVAPGRKFVELHLHAARVAARGLLALGILRGSRMDIAASGVVSAFFPHGLGHHVGLEVHDVSGDLRLLSADGMARLEGGKRETITPGDLIELRGGSEKSETRGSGILSAPIERQTLEPGMIVTVEPGM